MLNEEYLKNALKMIPQKCLLINILSRRSEQLLNGAKPLVEEESKDKVNIALKELLEGKIQYRFVEEDDKQDTGKKTKTTKKKKK